MVPGGARSRSGVPPGVTTAVIVVMFAGSPTTVIVGGYGRVALNVSEICVEELSLAHAAENATGHDAENQP